MLPKVNLAKDQSIMRWLRCWVTIGTANLAIFASAAEYEVDGNVTQTMVKLNGDKLHASASFTVFVRDCGWLIQTLETNEFGGVHRREIGSTNGVEIYECEFPFEEGEPGARAPNTTSTHAPTNKAFLAPMFAVMVSNDIPIGEMSDSVVGHLWLMFASRCYWPRQTTDRLTPIYDWHASVAMHGQNQKVPAKWDLLDGPESLPKEVLYLGPWGETNGLYQITGTNLAGGVLMPSGFTFNQFRIGPLNEQTFTHDMTLVKHVGVKVTAVRPGCSLASLIPTPEGPATIVDRRFDSGIPNRPPSYKNPADGQWPTLDQSKVIAKVQQAKDLQALNGMVQFRAQGGGQGQSKASARHSKIIFVVMCIFIAIPPIILLFLQKSKRS
jgi:hypothetical protein